LEIENITMESNLQVGQEPHYTPPRHQIEQRLRSKLGDCSFHHVCEVRQQKVQKSLARSQFSETTITSK
jgi:hypothetical protein